MIRIILYQIEIFYAIFNLLHVHSCTELIEYKSFRILKPGDTKNDFLNFIFHVPYVNLRDTKNENLHAQLQHEYISHALVYKKRIKNIYHKA